MTHINNFFKVGTLLIVFTLILSCTKEKSVDCEEKINSNCVCTQQYDPVCGCNNKTYGNACEASCAGVSSTPGECPK